MSDLIFSSNADNVDRIKEGLKFINADISKAYIYSGSWGCIGVFHNHYGGYEPYETEKYIAVMLGGPILLFTLNRNEQKNNQSGKTAAVLRKFKDENIIRWDEDVVGHFLFLMVEKESSKITIVTDHISSVPGYYYSGKQSGEQTLVVGSHPDAVAITAGVTDEIDNVSVADFFCHLTITFPYTIYKNINQLEPAAVTSWDANRNKKVSQYWIPYETDNHISFNDAVYEFRTKLQYTVGRMCENKENIALLLSGGEDSRAIAGMLPDTVNTSAFTFLDAFNREGKLASRIASIYGLQHAIAYRSPDYYLEQLSITSRLLGSQNIFIHAHSYGFHTKFNFSEFDAVFTGLAADAYCKAANAEGLYKSGIRFTIKNSAPYRYHTGARGTIKKNIENMVDRRRIERFEYLKSIRPQSSGEWVSLWPCAGMTTMADFFLNQKLFSCYDPFGAQNIVKFMASLPAQWKVNRKLFSASMKPVFKKSWNMNHTNGIYPYFGFWLNAPLLLYNGIKRVMLERIEKLTGLEFKNQGPWQKGYKMFETELGYSKMQNLKISMYKSLPDIFLMDPKKIINHNHVVNRHRLYKAMLHYSIINNEMASIKK